MDAPPKPRIKGTVVDFLPDATDHFLAIKLIMG
jgi:hypothetical protein